MKICGLVVCVNYADLFRRSISRWSAGFNTLLVVTTEQDKETQKLCREFCIPFFTTDIFYRNGAKFNKGAALSEALHKYPDLLEDWLIVFDADIVPPKSWRRILSDMCLVPGLLYGATRYEMDEGAREYHIDPRRRMPQSWVLGFFMLFHGKDPLVGSPAFDMHWPHAGNYDTTFCRRWLPQEQVILPIATMHLGEERKNWTGRGKDAELQSEFLGKRMGAEDWTRERMKNPPTLEARA